MTPSQRDLRVLYQRSGNRCAFPGCGKVLVHAETWSDDHVVISEVAHIVSSKLNGPRGKYPLPMEERDKYDNLILLCVEHHTIVDNQEHTYTVERLRQMKADHEQLMNNAAEQALATRHPAETGKEYARETVHSTLLPVLRMPRYIYGVPCDYNDLEEREVVKKIVYPADKAEMWPFIIRGGTLYCFQNLYKKGGPFHRLVNGKRIQRYKACEWWDEPDQMRWFVQLINRSLNKLTGRKGLNLDRRHRRYYFMPKEPGEPLTIEYRPLNQATATRQVVWQPITKKTGEPKSYWYHRAVALKYHRVSETHWCLSIRPEMHVTKDSIVPLESELIGSKVTRKKARMYNYGLLSEVQFWRDYLSESKPRMILPFGAKDQHIVISTTMMQAEIDWPGMPEEHQKPFKNVEYVEDLFSWAELAQLDTEDEDEEDWEDDEDEFWDE